MDDRGISLNKYISSTGRCSRREADRLIESGRVMINGKKAKKGNRVFEDDVVVLDGETIKKKAKPKSIYIAFHKPAGVTTTTNAEVKGNIIDVIGHEKRIFPIGRLDKDSTGLILLTNDGDIVNKILRQEYNHEKEYLVTTDRPITKEFVQKMSSGVKILGKVTKECEVEKLSKYQFRIVLTQGMNRQIRRMCEALDYKVKLLHRIRIMHIHLNHLKPGRWRKLKHFEVEKLLDTRKKKR